jgi:hypothetical protein
MPWKRLLTAEALGLARRSRDVLAANPVLGLLVPVGAGAIVVAGFAAGDQLALVAPVDPDGTVRATLLATMGLFLFVVGIAVSGQAPSIDRYDEQLRSVPVSRLELYVGITGIPLIAAFGALGAAFLPFGVGLFGPLGVAAAASWAVVFAVGQLACLLVGAAVGEAARRTAAQNLPARRARAAGLALLVLTVVLPILAGPPQRRWAWIQANLPLTSTNAPDPLHLATVMVVAAMAGAALLLLGQGNRRPRVHSVTRRSWRLRGSPFGVLPSWMALTAWRDREVRNEALLALGATAFAGAMLHLTLAERASLLVPATAATLMLIAGAPALVLSRPMQLGSWLLWTAPLPRHRLALAAFSGLAVVALVLAIVVTLPLAVAYGLVAPFVALAALVLAPVAAAIGRLWPWESRSMARQVATGLLMFVAFGLALQAVISVQARASLLVAGVPEVGLAGMMLGVGGLWAVGAILSLLVRPDAAVRR